jgi:hypothetical protein
MGAAAHEPGDFSQWFRGVTISDPLGVAQYFEVNAWSSAAVGPPFATTHYPAWHNTWVDPLTLSWELVPMKWYASVSFTFWMPDGSRYNNTPNPDYWTFEPHAAISYIGDGWNLTAHLIYDL